MSLEQNLKTVRQQISSALARAGRESDSVKLVAVTKTVDAETIRRLASSGHLIIGENRPQAMRDKVSALGDLPLEWHYIGNLQTNKIKYVYPKASLIHSVDRVDLLEQLTTWAKKTGRVCPCLLEVHISDESTKQGFAKDEVLDIIRSYSNKANLSIQGLMGMAPFVEDESMVRASFRLLKDIFDKSRSFEGSSYTPKELSMGMTDDFTIAIEEGATIVRVGRALFP